MKSKIVLVVMQGFLLIFALASFVRPAVVRYLEVDRCLDSGGAFDYLALECRYDVSVLPALSVRKTGDFAVASAGVTVLLVAGTGVALARLFATKLDASWSRLLLRWLGGGVLVIWALLALNNAAAGAWLSDGPPTEHPQLWWAQAIRCFWLSVGLSFTAAWVWLALKPIGESTGGESVV